MPVKTILNRLQKYPGFVYGAMRLVRWLGAWSLEVEIRPHARSRPQCLLCGRRRPGYDRLSQRRFEFVPLWGMKVFFLYAPRRVDCPTCGVHVEAMPWAQGKSSVAVPFSWFLAGWAKRLSWQEVAEAFQVNWHQVFSSRGNGG